MNKRRNVKNQNTKRINIKAINIGVLSGIIVCGIILFFLASVFVKKEVPSENLLEPIMIMSSGLGAFSGGYFAAKVSREKGLIYGLVCAFLMFIFIFIAGTISVRRGLSLVTLMRLIAMLTFGGIGGIVGVNKRKRK